MKKRNRYSSITFKPTKEVRKKIMDLMEETGNPASYIVLKCVKYALKKVVVEPRKTIIFRD